MILAACQRFRPDNAPAGWTIEAIKNRIRLEYGTGLTESERSNGEFPVYGSNGCVGVNHKHLVEGPGILVGRKGSVGEVHFSEKNFWPIDTVYFVRRLRNDDWRYLFYLLKYLNLARLNAATGVPGLTRRDAHFILGAFPEPSEQERISQILLLLDEATEAARGKLSACVTMKASLFQQLFSRGIPGQQANFSTATIFRHHVQVPNDWEVEPLKLSITAIDYGTNAASNDDKHGLPVVAIPQVVAPRFRLGQCSFVELPSTEAEALRLAEDDVLLVRTNGNPDYIGKSTVVGKDANEQHIVYASYLIRVRTDKAKLSGRYLNYFLASPLGRRQCLAMANTSAGNHNLGARSIRHFCIPRPGMQEQNEIVDLVDAAQDSIENAEAEVKSLIQLSRAIASNLLTGKLRVRD